LSEIIRGYAIFEIWYSRDKLMYDDLCSTPHGMIMTIWAQIQPYFNIGWEKYKKKIASGKLTADRAWFLFTKDYGDNVKYLQTCTLSL
jgi:hypothetical protein